MTTTTHTTPAPTPRRIGVRAQDLINLVAADILNRRNAGTLTDRALAAYVKAIEIEHGTDFLGRVAVQYFLFEAIAAIWVEAHGVNNAVDHARSVYADDPGQVSSQAIADYALTVLPAADLAAYAAETLAD